jgi:hypothetical protein
MEEQLEHYPEGTVELVYNYADKNEAFQLIIDLGEDYDGYNSVDNLKALIDELVEIARIGLTLEENRD